MKPLKARSFKEYVASKAATHDWLIPDLLPSEGLFLLAAKPKTGKSILAAQVVESLATGLPVLGRLPTRPCKPLYVQLDAPPNDWRKQIRQLGFESGDTLDMDDVPRFFLDTQAERNQLTAYIKAEGFDFVVWDSLEKLTMMDLNQTVAMRMTLERLRGVFPGPRLVVHHPRKPNGDATDSIVDAAAGSHYLAGEASALWGLHRKDKLSGRIELRGRWLDAVEQLERDPQTFTWHPATPKPEPPPLEWKKG